MKRRFSLAILLFLCGCKAAVHENKGRDFQKVLEQMPEKDRSALQTFLETLCIESQGGYVLYGSKPVCIEAFPAKEEGTIFLDPEVLSFCTKLKMGARVWQKWGLHRYGDDIALCVYEKPLFGKWIGCVLVHKKEVLRVFQEHRDLFVHVLGPLVTGEGLLDALLDPSKGFYEVLQGDRMRVLRLKNSWGNFDVKSRRIDDCNLLRINSIRSKLQSSILRRFHARNYFPRIFETEH